MGYSNAQITEDIKITLTFLGRNGLNFTLPHIKTHKTMLINSRDWLCNANEKIPLILFVQRARELLLHTTSFISKPKYSSVFLLSRELSFLTEQQKKSPHTSTQKNIDLILDELKNSLKIDEVAKSLIGDRFDELESILTNSTDLQAKIEAAQLLRSRIARIEYISFAKEEIIKIIEDGGKEKERLLNLTECAISAIMDIGYPAQTVYHLLNITFLNRNNKINVTGKDTIEKFFSYFDLIKHKYTVFFALTAAPENLSDYIPDGMYVIYKKGESDFNEIINMFPERSRKFFLSEVDVCALIQRVTVDALDPQSARSIAERDITLLSELIQLKQHKFKLSIKNESLVYRDEKNEYAHSNRPKHPIMRIPQDADCTLEQARNIFIKINSIENESASRFARAVQLHSSAINANESESQLINIWIALETLFLTSSTENKILKIIECVSPYILIATIFYDAYEVFELIEKHHKESWEKHISKVEKISHMPDILKLICAISVNDLEKEMTNFLGELDSDPLLRNKLMSRIKRSQKPGSIKSHIEEIDKKILYDLNRIYRARNQIVHIGYSASDLGEIIQRAHHYLDVILATIETTIGVPGGAFSIEQVTMEVSIMKKNLLSTLTKAITDGNSCNYDNFIKFNLGRTLLG